MRRLFVRQADPSHWYAVAERCPGLIVLGFKQDEVLARLRTQVLAEGLEAGQKRLIPDPDESELLIVSF
jgi:hypothetical protein